MLMVGTAGINVDSRARPGVDLWGKFDWWPAYNFFNFISQEHDLWYLEDPREEDNQSKI